MTILETRGLSIKVGSRNLVTGLDWQVRQGEFWCVLGRNGAGKSLLLHSLSGLHPLTAGTVLIAGRDIGDIPLIELAKLRGLLPQQIVDSFSCTVGDVAAIGRTPWRYGNVSDSNEDTRIVRDGLAQVGLLDRMHDDVTRLSGGERQRVAFAAMLVQKPTLMLFDEPTSHQDIAQQLLIMRLMRRLVGEHAVIASCHDINLAARFASHVLLLGDGFHVMGTTQEVLDPALLSRVYGCAFDRSDEGIMAV